MNTICRKVRSKSPLLLFSSAPLLCSCSSARFLASLAILLLCATASPAAQLTINVGSGANDGTGDTIRSAFQKVNTNFTSLFGSMGALIATDSGIFLGTNSLYFTNECYVTANQNTNVLIVSGAGTSAVNGVYTNGGGGLYVKPATTNGVWFDGIDWLLTNNAGATLYFLSADNPTNSAANWSLGTGSAPPPSTIFDSVTNCITVFASSLPVSMPLVSSNLYVDASIGNDTNALRGRIDRPWKLLQAALANQRFGDTVHLGPGIYPTNVAYGTSFNVSNRVTLKGAGRGVTFIGTEGGAEEAISCGSQVTLRDFTSYAVPTIGALGTSTNSLVDNIEVIGQADAIFLANWETTFTVNNCRLKSNYDGIADWEVDPGGSNRVCRIFNTSILCEFNPAVSSVVRCLEGGDNRIEMFGGSLECYNGINHNSCIRLDIAAFRVNKTGSVLLSNVRLRHASTNGLSLMVSNFNNLPVFLDNCTLEPFVPASLINGSFTNGWEHRWVGIPNGATRTNRLVDTRSLTNALVAASEQGHEVTVFDAGGTAAGTNIIIATSANQKITNAAPSISITANYGSMTLRVGPGTNWTLVAKTP